MKAQRKKLPQEANEFLRLHYPNSTVESVKMKKDEGDHAAYHVIAHRDGLSSHLYFDDEGKFLQKAEKAIYPEEYYEDELYGEL